MKLELMSMQELNKLINSDVSYVLREAAARELCKRENSLYSFYKFARRLTPADYLR